MSPNFALDDKLIFLTSFLYIGLFFAVFIVGTIAFTVFGANLSDAGWSTFWWGFCLFSLAVSFAISVWFAVGGLYDFRALFRRLAAIERDLADDGSVTATPAEEDARP